MSIVITQTGRVALIQLNQARTLNALNNQMLAELIAAMAPLDNDPNVGCFVITGCGKAFAAGADIKEMANMSFAQVSQQDHFANWQRFCELRTPKLAAVGGYALGGGCELAMMCDIIYASSDAQFGQPEISLGVMPGMGGTQRLTKLIGKSKAMHLILTGELLNAEQAEQAGLVAKVFSPDSLLPCCLEVAKKIASYSKPATTLATEAVDQALEVGLQQGLLFERRVFHSLFATAAQKEGMQAFIEKRAPQFN